MEKHCTARQAADDIMTHARCMLGNEGYEHTLRVCNTYCFSTATMGNTLALGYRNIGCPFLLFARVQQPLDDCLTQNQLLQTCLAQPINQAIGVASRTLETSVISLHLQETATFAEVSH